MFLSMVRFTKRSISHYWSWCAFAVAGAFLVNALYLPAKAVVAQILLEHAWQQTLDTGKLHRPWPWADAKTVAKIDFPAHNTQYIVLSGSTGPTLAFAPGHLHGSRLPNESGHMVLSGHRDTHFAVLEHVSQGETIHIHTQEGDIKTYQITSRRIIDSTEESLHLRYDADVLTLITCYPFDALHPGGPLRLRIDAELLAKHSYASYLQSI